MGIRPADSLTAPQAIETIRQLLHLSGSRGPDNNWLLNEVAKHVSKFTPLAELEHALAKNASTPTVCPAGPVVEGELREALLEIIGVLADPVKWEEDVSQKRFERLTKIGLIARAALTNDPPPSEHEGGQHGS